MNYNHLNKVYDYWRKDILPNLSHNFTVSSFDDYLKKFSFLPSGKWLRDMESVNAARLGFAIDPKKFVKKYKDHCITYSAPVKPEDGIQRAIYQISPTLHAEVAIWGWIEHDVLQSYASMFICYKLEEEFRDFSEELYKMKKEGNTDEKPTKSGFAAFVENSSN